jgi:hypothetical protein
MDTGERLLGTCLTLRSAGALGSSPDIRGISGSIAPNALGSVCFAREKVALTTTCMPLRRGHGRELARRLLAKLYSLIAQLDRRFAMAGYLKDVPMSENGIPELVARASSVLARELARLPVSPVTPQGKSLSDATLARPEGAFNRDDRLAQPCPVTGSKLPLGEPDPESMRRQAHELLATLLGALVGETRSPRRVSPNVAEGPNADMPFWPGSTRPSPAQRGRGEPGTDLGYEVLGQGPMTAAAAPRGGPAHDVAFPGSLDDLTGRVCPVTKAAAPGIFDKDQLRRQAHEFIETLLITFREATDEDALPAEEKVPLIRCLAATPAGAAAHASLTIANEESTSSDVALYATNFVADSGYEIPSLRVSIAPRHRTIPPNGTATFDITIAISQQTPPGTYSGLIQAMGSKYVKAVLSVEVL